MDEQTQLRLALDKAKKDEITRNTLIHQENIRREKTRLAAAARGTPAPLAILAHGDSWFSYPLAGNFPDPSRTDIEAQLEHMGNPNPLILNRSSPGASTIEEMSWPGQAQLIEDIQNQANWFGDKPDAILVSGGGDDLVGDQFCLFLKRKLPNKPGELDIDSFNGALGLVEVAYKALFDLRDKYAPGVSILGHCYDFAVPDGRSAQFLINFSRPWLKPSFLFRDYQDHGMPTEGIPVVKEALKRFKALLTGFHKDKKRNFVLVDTQDTLKNPDYTQDWANEIHPYPEGFRALADKFLDALRGIKKFQGRI
jgi:hypothetical protein